MLFTVTGFPNLLLLGGVEWLGWRVKKGEGDGEKHRYKVT